MDPQRSPALTPIAYALELANRNIEFYNGSNALDNAILDMSTSLNNTSQLPSVTSSTVAPESIESQLNNMSNSTALLNNSLNNGPSSAMRSPPCNLQHPPSFTSAQSQSITQLTNMSQHQPSSFTMPQSSMQSHPSVSHPMSLANPMSSFQLQSSPRPQSMLPQYGAMRSPGNVMYNMYPPYHQYPPLSHYHMSPMNPHRPLSPHRSVSPHTPMSPRTPLSPQTPMSPHCLVSPHLNHYSLMDQFTRTQASTTHRPTPNTPPPARLPQSSIYNITNPSPPLQSPVRIPRSPAGVSPMSPRTAPYALPGSPSPLSPHQSSPGNIKSPHSVPVYNWDTHSDSS